MKKFFLFRREVDNSSNGETVSNSGEGISTIAISSDNVSYITTKLGGVVITFNEASAFESTFLRLGESLPKTKVEISCKEGEESLLMESILNFISSESKKTIMRFDNVERNSTFSSFDDSKKPAVIVPTLAVETSTGFISQGSEEDKYQNTSGEINFFGNYPQLDYNHEGLSSFAHGATVSSWKNDGRAGASYNISTVANTPSCVDPDSADRGLTTKSVLFAENEYMTIPSYSVRNDYLLYMVWTTQYTDSLYNHYLLPMYGDGDGETTGPGGVFLDDLQITKAKVSNGLISIRHDGDTNPPSSVKTSKQIPQIIISGNVTASDIPCHVLVIRRSYDNDVFVYDRDGEVVATVPNSQGALLLERLGTTNELQTNSFNKGSIARFGVIDYDPGADFASTLAKDLFNLYYKP